MRAFLFFDEICVVTKFAELSSDAGVKGCEIRLRDPLISLPTATVIHPRICDG